MGKIEKLTSYPYKNNYYITIEMMGIKKKKKQVIGYT